MGRRSRMPGAYRAWPAYSAGSSAGVALRGAEIGEHVGPVAVPGEPLEGHLGARHGALRVREEAVQVLEVPGALFRRHGGGVGEALVACHRPVHDVPEIGADLVLSALVHGVAGGALLEHPLPLGEVGIGQQLRQRHCRRLGRRLVVSVRGVLLEAGDLVVDHPLVVGMLELAVGREGDEPRRHRRQARKEDRAEDLVQLVGVHADRWSGWNRFVGRRQRRRLAASSGHVQPSSAPGDRRGIASERDRAAQRAPGNRAMWEMSGAGPHGGPAGATAPARRRRGAKRAERAPGA